MGGGNARWQFWPFPVRGTLKIRRLENTDEISVRDWLLSQGNEEYGEEYGFLWTGSSKGNKKRGEKKTGGFESHKVQAYKDQGNEDKKMMWIIDTATRRSENSYFVDWSLFISF